MKERLSLQFFVLSIALILLTVLAPVNLSSLPQLHLRSTLTADGVPLPPPEPPPKPRPSGILDSTQLQPLQLTQQQIASLGIDGVPLPPPEPPPKPKPSSFMNNGA